MRAGSSTTFSRLTTPRPSIDGGKITFKLPKASGANSMSSLTQQQNQRLLELKQREQQGLATASTASADDMAAAAALQLQVEAAAARAKKEKEDQIDLALYSLDVMLSQFVCPTHVAAAPPKRAMPGEAAASDDKPPVKTKAQQRSATERLYTGSGVGTKMPSRVTERRVPPAKLLEARLHELRNDAAARQALHAECRKHMRDIKEESLRKCGGGVPKDFLSQNVKASSRPRSAPAARTLSPMDVPLDARPAFRPGGAPEELYERPGPPPYDYVPPRLRPQSAMPGVRSSSQVVEAVDSFRPARTAAAAPAVTVAEAYTEEISLSPAKPPPTAGAAAAPAAALIV